MGNNATKTWNRTEYLSMVRSCKGCTTTAVNGEVYEVDDQMLATLDGLEKHPGWYRREQLHTSVGLAWMYVLRSEDDLKAVRENRVGRFPEVPGCDWRAYLEAKD